MLKRTVMLKRTTVHKTGDEVDHPTHYNVHPSGVECIDVVEHMTFNVGNAIKYLWRAGYKGNLIEDVEKARWYIDREVVRLKKQDEKHKASLQPPSLPNPRRKRKRTGS